MAVAGIGALVWVLAPVLDEWLRGRPERGHAMNLDGLLLARPDCVIAAASDRHGVPQAFARFAVAAGGRVLIAPGLPAAAAWGLLHGLDRWIEVAPLYRFVNKVQPGWRPRWLLPRSWSELGSVRAAVLVAEFGPRCASAADAAQGQVPAPGRVAFQNHDRRAISVTQR